MAITLNGTTGITSPDINVTAQTTGFTTTGNLTAADLTLSGGVYLGGTGSANYLDDYEEGSWTPVSVGTSVGITSSYSRYTKIGNYVIANSEITIAANSNNNQVRISLPIALGASVADGGFVRYSNSNLAMPYIVGNASNTDMVVYNSAGGALTFVSLSGKRFDFTIIYKVN